MALLATVDSVKFLLDAIYGDNVKYDNLTEDNKKDMKIVTKTIQAICNPIVYRKKD